MLFILKNHKHNALGVVTILSSYLTLGAALYRGHVAGR